MLSSRLVPDGEEAEQAGKQEKGWDAVDPPQSSISLLPRSALAPAEGSGEERGQEEALWQKSPNYEEEQFVSLAE